MNQSFLFARASHQRLRQFSVGAVLAVASIAAHAEAEEPIKTDRPDFVESSDVVGKGRFQVETSFAFERNKDAGVRDRTTTTPTLLRFGTGKIGK